MESPLNVVLRVTRRRGQAKRSRRGNHPSEVRLAARLPLFFFFHSAAVLPFLCLMILDH